MTAPYALGTFSEAGGVRWPGLIRDGKVLPLTSTLANVPEDLGRIFADWEVWGGRIDAAIADAPTHGWKSESDLVAHLPYKPENLFCAGANYRKHVIDLIVDQAPRPGESTDKEERRKAATAMMDRRAAQGKPFVFVGVRSAIAGPDEPLVVPYDHTEPDWELEMAVVIGKPARRVSRAGALSHVAGYTIANDITARELVARPDVPQMGMDWMACKGAPGFKILGPYITPARFVPNPQELHIRLSLNDTVMQDEGTNDMIFDTAKIISFISDYVQLHPGDVILTGSPSGNGTHYRRFLRDGDVMKGEIDGLVGVQVVHCIAEQP
jgi:2,4-diketo-3-deoxy-L-fuconate hydrolase